MVTDLSQSAPPVFSNWVFLSNWNLQGVESL